MKTALVTGAAGGLGTAVVSGLLELDYQIVALDIDVSGLERFKSSPNLSILQADITNHTAVKQLPVQLGLQENGLDALVCLAGKYDAFPVTEHDSKYFQEIMAVNFHANVSLVQALLAPLIRKQGRVVIISSESHKIQSMFQPYMISKAALEAYARTAWQEMALKGVWLTVIRPGAFSTPLLNWMYREVEHSGSIYHDEFWASLNLSKKMVGKVTTPETVARTVIRALTARRPKRIYRVNNNPMLSLLTLLPAGLLDKMIVKRFKKKSV